MIGSMKIGTKVGFFTPPGYIEKIWDWVDFFEVYITEDFDYRRLKEIGTGKEFIIHAAHQGHGVNLADSTTREGARLLEVAIEAANYLKASKIIFHPGEIESTDCNLDESKTKIMAACDDRLCVENMPITVSERGYLCTSPSQVEKYQKDTKTGFCLDIAHCFEAAWFEGKDPWKDLSDYLEASPRHFHLNDSRCSSVLKSAAGAGHLPLREGDLNLSRIVKLLPPSAEITLETPVDNPKRQIEEVKYLGSLIV